MRAKIINLQKKLSQGLVGREEVIRLSLLALIAGEHLLLVGPPGTAKSMVARRLHDALSSEENSNHYFEYLLTKFSTPEELFGPLSISELKQDRFVRNTSGFLPNARVAFLDEIFKSSSSILNSLLTILNERKYHNGTSIQDVPLQSIIAASNELPKGQSELAALYDRFLLRFYVGYLNSDQLKLMFDIDEPVSLNPDEKLTLNEIKEIREQSRKVTFPETIQVVLQKIWQEHKDVFKDNLDEQLSDRRFIKILHLLKISAVTNNRLEVDFSDLMILRNCLWNNDINVSEINTIILKNIEESVNLDNKVAKQVIEIILEKDVFKGAGDDILFLLLKGKHYYIEEHHVNVGDYVKTGDRLLSINISNGNATGLLGRMPKDWLNNSTSAITDNALEVKAPKNGRIIELAPLNYHPSENSLLVKIEV